MSLKFARWQAKEQLTPANYESLTASVSRFLFHTLSLGNEKLDVEWARTFVRVYAHDTARHVLQLLGRDEASSEFAPSPDELSIDILTLQLSGRLAKLSGCLTVSALVDLAILYGAQNTTSLQILFRDSFVSTPVLLQEFETEVLPTFVAALQNPDRQSTYALSQLLHCSPQVALLFAQHVEWGTELARGYQVALDTLATSHGGMAMDVPEKAHPWQINWLYTKTGLLDIFHAIVQALLESSLPKHADCLLDMLFAILDLPSPSAIPRTPFVSQPLLADYQYAFDLSGMLSDKFGDADEARADLLVATLNDLSPAPREPKPAGVLSVLLDANAGSRSLVQMSARHSKGKGKAAVQEPELEGELDLAVSQILDILPNESHQHIRRCLQHHAFEGDSAKLISALLEGTLPMELADKSAGEHVLQESVLKEDHDGLFHGGDVEFSQGWFGKAGDDADALLRDRSFVEQMKADIIRRVQEFSDNEDFTGEPQDRDVAFYDELDDDVESLVDKGVKVIGDGEESDDTDDDSPNAATNSPETILELAYIEDPKLFDRDAATRRSQARQDLKTRTGWGDEQIEGWRIMLERNPKKDRILRKHEFAGNALLVPNLNTLEPGSSTSSRGGPSHRDHGDKGKGRGRGSGRGRVAGGGVDSVRDRALKDKNKARQANHNRKRGHDKKMTRGGQPAPM